MAGRIQDAETLFADGGAAEVRAGSRSEQGIWVQEGTFAGRAFLHVSGKRMGSGDSPGLQNRCGAASLSRVGSTPTRFRHVVLSLATLGISHAGAEVGNRLKSSLTQDNSNVAELRSAGRVGTPVPTREHPFPHGHCAEQAHEDIRPTWAVITFGRRGR